MHATRGSTCMDVEDPRAGSAKMLHSHRHEDTYGDEDVHEDDYMNEGLDDDEGDGDDDRDDDDDGDGDGGDFGEYDPT